MHNAQRIVGGESNVFIIVTCRCAVTARQVSSMAAEWTEEWSLVYVMFRFLLLVVGTSVWKDSSPK